MKNFIKTFGYVVVLVLLLWAGAYVLTHNRWCFQIYSQPYGSAFGHLFASKLAEAQRSSGKICLLVGPSSVREAFVEEIMEETVPDLKFINGGTTGGSIHVFDAMVELLEQSKVNPYIIVLGLNARMLISRKINLNGNGYTDFLDYSNGREIVNAEISSFAHDADRELLINSFWPWHRLSRQLGRLIRVGLFRLHKKLYWNKQLDRNDFSIIKRELRPMPKFRYKDKAPLSSEKFDAVLKKYEEEGMYNPSNYAKPQHMESLRQVLESSLKLSQNVVVVLMPEHSYGRENISSFAKAPLLFLLKDYEEKRFFFLDLTNLIPDSGLRDMGHLLPSSRTEFSRLVAQELNILLKETEENNNGF